MKDEDIVRIVGSTIRHFRNEKKLSMVQTCESAGVSYPALQRWETGERCPDFLIIVKLCATLEISLKEFSAHIDEEIKKLESEKPEN